MGRSQIKTELLSLGTIAGINKLANGTLLQFYEDHIQDTGVGKLEFYSALRHELNTPEDTEAIELAYASFVHSLGFKSELVADLPSLEYTLQELVEFFKFLPSQEALREQCRLHLFILERMKKK